MSDSDFHNLYKAAADPSTPTNLLIELGHNSNVQIRLAVACNRNTPFETLIRLEEEFPDAIDEHHDRRSIQLSLARSTSTSQETLANLAVIAKDDEEVCQAVAKNINTPIKTLKSLMCWRATGENGDYPRSMKVTKEVINNPNIPISYLEQIIDGYASSDWDAFMVEFCILPRLSFKLIEKISKTSYADLLIDLDDVQNSPQILDNIAHNHTNEFVAIKLLQNPITSSSTIEYLATSSSRTIRNTLIYHFNVTKKALDTVLFMQKKPGVPVKLLEELAQQPPRFSILQHYNY